MAIVSFRHPDSIKEYTRITERIAAAGTTLKVKNTEGFSANDYIIIGSVGSEKTEIKKITTVDSVTQLTIAATSFAHNIDDPVAYTPYNQMEFYSASTKTGTKTVQGAKVDLEVDDFVTEVNLSAVSSGYVFSRFYNSTSTSFSSYSPAVDVSGFAENSLRHCIDMARLRAQEKTEKMVTDNDLLNVAKECADIIETHRKKWGFTQETAYTDLTAAVQSYYRPADLAGPDSIERVFLGYDHEELTYVDNKDFWWKMRSFPKTHLTAQADSGATTLTVKDTSAFGTTGTLALSNNLDVSYTGKTYRSFTGVSGISTTHTANTEIFQNGDLDQPTHYSWWKNHILVYPAPDKFYNMHVDYYETIPRMTDVTVSTVVTMPSLYTWYLMSEIFRMRKKTGKADRYYKRFTQYLSLLSRKNRNKQAIRMQPATQYIHKAGEQSDAVVIEREHGGA
jgi:hypothetical protein